MRVSLGAPHAVRNRGYDDTLAGCAFLGVVRSGGVGNEESGVKVWAVSCRQWLNPAFGATFATRHKALP